MSQQKLALSSQNLHPIRHNCQDFLLPIFPIHLTDSYQCTRTKKKDSIAEFWGWFERNRAFYEDLDDEKLGEHLDPLYQRVAAISPELAVEISRRMDNGVRELVISANGNIALFPKVEEIVAAAPELDRWMITAFRPRMLMESVLEADDLKLDMSKMSFTSFDTDGELEVCIFAENIKDKDEPRVFHFGMILVDNLLGEYDTAMKVKAFAFRDFEEAPENWPLRPLVQLPGVVDEFHRKTNN